MVHHSLDYKLSAIKYYKKVNNYVEVCKVFDCNRTSFSHEIPKSDVLGCRYSLTFREFIL